MPDPTTAPDSSGDPEAAETVELAPDDGERLVRKTTHEVEPGDMLASDAS